MNVIFLTLEFVAVSALLLGAARLGPTAVVTVVATMQFFQTILSTMFWEVAPGLLVSPGSSILFASNLAILLYVYVRAGARAARSIFYAIVGANFFIILMSQIFDLHIAFQPPNDTAGISDQLFHIGFSIPVFGVVVLAIAQVTALTVFNTLRRRSVPVFVAMTTALVVALLFDSFGFVIPIFYDSPDFDTILLSSVLSKGSSGLLFGLTWGAALQLRGVDEQAPLRVLFQELSYADKGGLAGVVSGRYDEDWSGTKTLDADEWFRSLPSGVCVCVDDEVVLANKRMASWLDVKSPDDVIGRPIAEWFPASVVEKLSSQVQRQRGPVPAQAHVLCGSDRTHQVETSAFPFELDGTPAIVFVTNDVTAREQLREQLTQSGRLAAVGTLAAGLAHEVNNPLTMVIANQQVAMEVLDEIEGLGGGGPAVDELREIIEDAIAGGERVRSIIDQLMMLSRIDSRTFEFVDPAELVDSVVADARSRSTTVEILVEVEATPSVYVDRRRMRQALLNLVINAIQAAESDSAHPQPVRVRVGCEGSVVFIDITDSGPGIPPTIRDRVMEPFFTTKAMGQGTGLGLAVTHRVVESHDGQLTCTSEVGQGTTFRIELPTASDVPSAAE